MNEQSGKGTKYHEIGLSQGIKCAQPGKSGGGMGALWDGDHALSRGLIFDC